LVQSELGAEDLRRRQADGGEVSDLVLGTVFDALKRGDGEMELAEEFFKFLIPHAEARSHGRVAPDFKRHLESQDLANSVLGNIWSDVDKLEFTTFPQFLAMVIQRLSWKASNRGRDLRRKKRSEDARVDLDVGEMGDLRGEQSPITELVRAEDVDLFIKTIMALPIERERKLIMDHLEGRSIAEMAETHGLEVESARKALNRALKHAREHLDLAKRARDEEGETPPC
jgi:DNA-directed RNA polymerase specialized sigma24 family protein